MASQELLEWCDRHGVMHSLVKAAPVAEGGRGLVASADLQPGTCFLRVPERLLLSVHSARRGPQMAAALQQHGADLSSEQVLAVHLLHEVSKGASSFWHPYLRSLPHSYTTAACFSPRDVAALQVPHAQQAVQAAVDAAIERWRQALPLLHALQLTPKWRSRAAWLWAASTVSSRSMYLPNDPAGTLTPLGDFANYRPPPPPFTPTLPAPLPAAAAHGRSDSSACAAALSGRHVDSGADQQRPRKQQQEQQEQRQQQEDDICGDGSLDVAAREYCLYTRAGCAAGEQVFLCYGRHTNLGLLLHYGFVLPDNPHDTALLPPWLLPEEVQSRLQSSSCSSGEAGNQGAGDCDPGSSSSDCYVHENGAPSWALLRALRLAGATAEERRSRAFLVLQDQPISSRSEQAAMEMLRQACQQVLQGLPTTAEEDEALLSDSASSSSSEQGELSECSRVAVEWRLGYKRAVLRAVAVADRTMAALGTAAPAPPDITSRLAGLMRRPKLL